MKRNDSPPETTSLSLAAESREIAEVQAAIFIARKLPRDIENVKRAVVAAHKDIGLAEVAEYEYPRGGNEIIGPSIHSAKVIAQCWGNIWSDIREIESNQRASHMEARSWDLETNVRVSLTYWVPHSRYTKNGAYDLHDPRDIYEAVANIGSRRLRACILSVIPRHVINLAQATAQETLVNSLQNGLPAAVEAALSTFEKLGIPSNVICDKFGRKREALSARCVVALRRILASIRDGIGRPEQFFDLGKLSPTDRGKIAESAAAMLTRKRSSTGGSSVALPAQTAPPDYPVEEAGQDVGKDAPDGSDDLTGGLT